ncbi:MAG: hypothetical protein ACKPKO_40460 [Candidatus Fonsibacter sp.]
MLNKQQDRLLKQLEAMVRMLEFENVDHTFLPREHGIIRAVVNCYREHIGNDKQQEIKGRLGSPHVQKMQH